MRKYTPIAVTSCAFSTHPILREELLKRYSNVRFNDNGDSLSGDNLIEFLQGIKKVISSVEKFDESIFSALPELNTISKYGDGLDTLDIHAMAKRGIRLGWTGGCNRRSVAEFTLAMMLNALRHIPQSSSKMSHGLWQPITGKLLSESVIGIIGMGSVGQDLVQLLRPFNCKILAYDTNHNFAFNVIHGVSAVSLDELLLESDIVSVHLELNKYTKNLLNPQKLELMKQRAVLINTARGGIIDEKHLKQMLTHQRISTAVFDVFADEPCTDLELLSLDNFIATPHIAGSTEQAALAMGITAINGLDYAKVPRDAAIN